MKLLKMISEKNCLHVGHESSYNHFISDHSFSLRGCSTVIKAGLTFRFSLFVNNFQEVSMFPFYECTRKSK